MDIFEAIGESESLTAGEGHDIVFMVALTWIKLILSCGHKKKKTDFQDVKSFEHYKKCFIDMTESADRRM